MIKINSSGSRQMIYPNPTKNQTFTLKNSFKLEQPILYDLAGKIIPIKVITTTFENQIILQEKVASGLYIFSYAIQSKMYYQKINSQ